jgi:hypothetical protein
MSIWISYEISSINKFGGSSAEHFFIFKDQKYEIYYTIAEKDRGGEFEKGYEHIFNSL